MMSLFLVLTAVAQLSACTGCSVGGNNRQNADNECDTVLMEADSVIVGAARTDVYLPLLEGKRVGLFSNHTGMVGDRHTLDILLDSGVQVVTVFSPEHGFRGNADAGEHVSGGVDAQTGVKITSLYDGGKRGPAQSLIDSLDVIVCDIQDVGLRFYTYYCSMLDLMNVAVANGKEFVVLDRPNPNGMTVDGPILDMKYKSGVGRLPIPTVHGMTLGELASMIVGEGWLNDGRKDLSLSVIPCENYTHETRYELPVAPSPNLPTMRAIYLYPSTCFFEGTDVSLGRGTPWPFEVYGSPEYEGGAFEFTPESRPGAKNPPLLGKLCHGVDLRNIPLEKAIADGLNLEYVIDAYNKTGRRPEFFTKFFELLAGNGDIRRMIIEGRTADEIKATWADDVTRFRTQRAPYLIYPEK